MISHARILQLCHRTCSQIVAALALTAGLAGAAQAATITVNSSADVGGPGICTLRDAITAANTNAAVNGCAAGQAAATATDYIQFAIASGCNAQGVCIIRPTTVLPSITEDLWIDGYTQTGAQKNTNAAGSAPAITGLNTVIKIELDGVNAPLGSAGLTFSTSQTGSLIEGLAIVNYQSAITVASQRNVVRGNFIGVHADGATAGSNSQLEGVFLAVGSDSSTVGGFNVADRNLISAANTDVSVKAHSISILRNLIGTDATGTLALGSNTVGGIGIFGALSGSPSSGTQIQQNLISGNTGGFAVRLYQANNTNITGNTIGLAAGGLTPLANVGGVYISDNGGTYPSHGNAVTFNAISGNSGDAIVAYGDSTYGNPFTANRIWNNGGLGINLVKTGEGISAVTANDPPANLDADIGPNGLQNFPVIVSAVVNGTGGFDIAFTLDSAANTAYNVYAYASDACHSSGYGQGQYFATGLLASPTTNAAGHASGTLSSASMPTGWAQGKYVTLLADNQATGDTSEFSACMQIAAAPAGGTPPLMGNVPDQTATVGTAITPINLAGYVTPTDGDPILSYAYTGTLPPALSLNTATGVISGTPSTAGTYNLTVTATDKDGTSNADAIRFAVAAAAPPASGNVAAIPTLSEWGLLLMSLLLMGLASLGLRKPLRSH